MVLQSVLLYYYEVYSMRSNRATHTVDAIDTKQELKQKCWTSARHSQNGTPNELPSVLLEPGRINMQFKYYR